MGADDALSTRGDDVATYRAGHCWGVTVVREGVEPGDGDRRPDDQLVAVVVNGDQALAERICALLTADDAANPDVP